MDVALGNLGEGNASQDRVALLAISADEGARARLAGIFSHTRWRLIAVPNLNSAQDFLKDSTIGVLVCDCALPDGSWRDLLERVSESAASPVLIVAASDPDDGLWAEALNLGAYDVLSKPFDHSEVIRIVSLAWLHWKEQTTPAPKAPMGKASDRRTHSTSATA